MSDFLKSTFRILRPPAQSQPQQAENEHRKLALESIAGSMVFVDASLIYWDIADA